jgi:hypothetical protein
MFSIVGCGGGGGDDGAVDGDSVVAPEVQEGVFLDSPVAGLRYVTDTQAGITDEAGRFHFLSGETVTFSIGDVPLGNARGQEIVTPLDLVDGAEDVTHPTVTNMIRFMQSLDEDGNPENGIFIPPHVRDEVDGRPIDFHMGIEDFENHPHVMGMFDTLNGTQAFPHGPVHLRSVEEARDHMREHMGEGFGPGTGQPGDGGVGDMPVVGGGGGGGAGTGWGSGMRPGNMPFG